MSTSKVDDPVKTAAGDEAQEKPLLDQKAETDDKEKVVDKEATIPASEAFWNMWRLARWMMVNALLHPIYSIVNAMVLGHQENEKMLAGLGLGSLTIGIMCLSIGTNFNGGLGTFISHAYGQKEYRMCQVYRNRAVFLNTILYVVLAIPLIFIRRIYIAIGQDEEMADYATTYVHITLPFIYFYYVSQAYSTYACQQEVTWYGFYAMLAGTVSHGIMILIFYVWLDMGYQGVIWATGVMFLFRFSGNYFMVVCRNDVKQYDDVHFFSRETTMNLMPLFKKSMSATALGVWGWWSFDIFTLMATYLGATQAGGQTIMRAIGLLTFMLPVGFSMGCSIMLGKSVGEERTNLAMTYYRVAQLTSICITAVQMLLLVVLRDQFIGIFTTDPEIAEVIEHAWGVLVIFTFFDATQSVSGSFIKSTGKQCKGAVLTSTAYWAFGIPIAYLCGLHLNGGVRGIWVGPTLACAYLTLMYNILIVCLDWPALYVEIRERRDEEKAERQRLLDEDETRAAFGDAYGRANDEEKNKANTVE